jgi:molybdopterin-containing oxidoreductase family membrane subunit
VIFGAFCQLYVFIVGGESFPLEIFPGMSASSSFFDGQVDQYVPSLPEILLGLSGIGIAFTMTVVGVRVLPFLPQDDLAKLQTAGAD